MERAQAFIVSIVVHNAMLKISLDWEIRFLTHPPWQTEPVWRLLRRRVPASLILPAVRAIIREVLTAHFFVTRPRYLKRMLALQSVVLRI